MSETVSAARHQDVADDELVAAVEAAEGNCLNGLPDREAVAAECALSARRVGDRLRSLAERDHVAIHETVRADRAGTRNSFEVLTPSEAVDPDERQVGPQGVETYTRAECVAAVREVAARVDADLTATRYRRERDDEHPSAKAVQNHVGEWDTVRELLDAEVRTDGGPLTCDVKGCERSAIVRVLPTHGETEDSALRCRECLDFDLDRGWFEEWAEKIRARDEQSDSAFWGGRSHPDSRTDGGTDPLDALRNADDRVLQAVADAEEVDPDALSEVDRERLEAMCERLDSLETDVDERVRESAGRVRDRLEGES